MSFYKIVFLAYYIFYKSILNFAFNKHNKYSISIDTLYNCFSYRIPNKTGYIKYFLIIIKQSLFKVCGKKNQPFFQNLNEEGEISVISNEIDSKELLIDNYLSHLGVQKINSIISFDDLWLEINIASRAIFLLIIIFNLPILLIISFFFKIKRNGVLVNIEIIETIILIFFLKKRGVNEVISFTSYEKSANFMTCVLNKNLISVTKICSPNPITIHYQKVVSNTFVFTAPYQKDAYLKLKSNWYVENTKLWPVLGFKKYMTKYYKNKNIEQNSNIIGFYSSAFARRNDLGIMHSNPLYYSSEIKLLSSLNKFLINSEEYILKIYLHPLEKKNIEIYNKSKNYYMNLFQEINEKIKFQAYSENTWESFHDVNIAVSVISTINSERLFCGYKTFFAPLSFKESFFVGQKINSIVYLDEELFLTELEKNLRLTRFDFFSKKNLSNYAFYGLH